MNTATEMTPLDIIIGADTSPILNDEDYRLVLKAKILQNQWRGTKKEVYDFWQQYFPANPIMIQDNQDMTMNILLFGMPAGIRQDLVRNGYIVPKPAAVRINYAFPVTTLFAYDYDTAFMRGYNQGEWASF